MCQTNILNAKPFCSVLLGESFNDFHFHRLPIDAERVMHRVLSIQSRKKISVFAVATSYFYDASTDDSFG